MTDEKQEPKPGDRGVCGFCGTGGGYLTDQGDESSQYLSSAVRSGEPGNWTYEKHPNSLKANHGQSILWCGHCLGGLEHKFQRHDDTNLRAECHALQLWMEMDGLRWSTFHSTNKKEEEAFKKHRDDPAIHLRKLWRERDLHDAESELERRIGGPMRGWRK